MRPNPLLPVFHALDPAHPWPDTVEPTVLSLSIAHFAAAARALAVTAQDNATPPGGLAPATHRVDVVYMTWAATAGHEARQVMRAAKLRTSGAGEDLLKTLTAVLLLRTGERAVGTRREHHDKCLLNKALAVADWVGATGRRTPTADVAEQFFVDQLPPSWLWATGPGRTDDTAARGFSVVRLRAGEEIERVTVTTDAGNLRITHRGSPHNTETAMTWPELCQHMARAAAALGTDAS